MPSSIEQIAAEALQLAPTERARLVERLIASLAVDPKVEKAWATAEVDFRGQLNSIESRG